MTPFRHEAEPKPAVAFPRSVSEKMSTRRQHRLWNGVLWMSCIVAFMGCSDGESGADTGGAGGGGGAGDGLEMLFDGDLGSQLAVDETYVYFAKVTPDYLVDVVRMEKTGGLPQTVVPDGSPNSIVSAGQYLYLATEAGLFRVNKQDGDTVSLDGQPARAIRIDEAGGYIYWVTRLPSYFVSLVRRPLAGGEIEDVVTSEPSIAGFVVAGGYAYWIGADAVRRTPTGGGPGEVFVARGSEADPADRPWSIGRDETFVYLVSGSSDEASMLRVPLTGGEPEVIGTGDLALGAHLADAGAVYYSDGDGEGSIVRVDSATGASERRIIGKPFVNAMVTDGTYLYLSDVSRLHRIKRWDP